MPAYTHAVQKIKALLRRSTVRYAIVGGITSTIDYCIFSLLYLMFGVWYVYATMISASSVWALNFLLHKLWTFKDEGQRAVTGAQAVSHAALKVYNGYLLVPYLLYLFAEHYGISPMLGKLGAGIFIAVQNYTLFYYVIFNPKLRMFLHKLLAR